MQRNRILNMNSFVEAHPAPEKAISDGAQPFDTTQFAKMMEELKPHIALWQESRAREVAAVASALVSLFQQGIERSKKLYRPYLAKSGKLSGLDYLRFGNIWNGLFLAQR